MGCGNTSSQPSTISLAYGTLRMEPCQTILAGEFGTWKLIFTAGSRGIAPGGCLRLSTDTDTDWGIPQVADPAAAEYLTIETPEGIEPETSAYRMTNVQVKLTGRDLRAGEEIVLIIGDRSGGGPGSRSQTTYERYHFFDLLVDAIGDGSWVRLVDRPCTSIRGGEAVSLTIIAPSIVEVDEPFRVMIRAQDRFGNPSSTFRGPVRISLSQGTLPAQEVLFTQESDGVALLEGCTLQQEGIFRLEAEEAGGNLSAQSNPVLCRQVCDDPRLFWGEPHGGQLHLATKIDEFFRYARDVSALDFCGYQANDERLSGREYAIQQKAEIQHHMPGRFIPLPGFEWSATTRFGGHHNVYFARFGQPIRRAAHGPSIAHEGDQSTDLTTAEALHEAYRGTDTVITPHVGGGRADLSRHDGNTERAIEVTSTHGTFEWFMRDALERRIKVGFVGGSDGYTGRPGLEYPGYVERRFAKGGYTALLAQDLTLPSLFVALRQRRAYATTGARILVSVEIEGSPMGSELATHELPRITGLISGTAPIESIEIYRGTDLIHNVALEAKPDRNLLRVLWEGSAHRDSYSAFICDGQLALVQDHEKDALRVSGPIKELRFDSPRCWVKQSGDDTITWHGVTSGYRSGFVAPLALPKGSGRVELTLSSSLGTMKGFGGFGDAAPMRMCYTPMETIRRRIALAALDEGPVRTDLGDLNRRITLSWAPQPLMQDTTFDFTDPAPQPGTNAYWLRVIQQDQEMAWTSPIYVDWTP